MINLGTVLVPTDFSECSDAALRYGRALASAFGATLHLLHVVQDPYTQPWAAEAFPASLGDMLNAIADFYDEELDTRMATVLSLVEPVLLVLMAVIVAVMLLAFYLPMFQAISAVQGTVR